MARFFAGQSTAPAAGTPWEAEGVIEERFHSWDTGSYDVNRFFESLERLVKGVDEVQYDEAVVGVGRKQEKTYMAQITKGTRFPEAILLVIPISQL